MALSFRYFPSCCLFFLPFQDAFPWPLCVSIALQSFQFLHCLCLCLECTAALHLALLRCLVVPFFIFLFFGGSPLQFHWTFSIGLVIGVSLALLSSLNTPVCLGSFSCRVAEGDSGGGVCAQRMMLVKALQETDSERCFVWRHLSFPVCSEHSPLPTLLYFCLKINLGHENFFF